MSEFSLCAKHGLEFEDPGGECPPPCPWCERDRERAWADAAEARAENAKRLGLDLAKECEADRAAFAAGRADADRQVEAALRERNDAMAATGVAEARADKAERELVALRRDATSRDLANRAVTAEIEAETLRAERDRLAADLARERELLTGACLRQEELAAEALKAEARSATLLGALRIVCPADYECGHGVTMITPCFPDCDHNPVRAALAGEETKP